MSSKEVKSSTLENILIVDDDKTVLTLLEKALEQDERSILTTFNPGRVMSVIEQYHISLVICDLNMPGVNGFQLIEKIRSHSNKLELPIIVLTHDQKNSSMEESFKKGANDFLTKPINISELRVKVDAHLQLMQLHHLQLILKEGQTLNSLMITYKSRINKNLDEALFNLEHLMREPQADHGHQLRKNLKDIQEVLSNIEHAIERHNEENYLDSVSFIKAKKA